MPGENIQRSIKKAAGELIQHKLRVHNLQGYGVSGAAVIVGLTDNKNRTGAT